MPTKPVKEYMYNTIPSKTRPRVTMCLLAMLTGIHCLFFFTNTLAADTPPALPALDENASAENEEIKIAKDLERLKNMIAEEKSRLDLTQVPGTLPEPSASLRETWLAMGALQVAKANDHLADSTAGSEKIGKLLALGETLLQNEAPEKMPYAVSYGRLQEQAYFARNDQSVQPYYVYRPPSYTGERPWPLVIFLHGWVPDTSRNNPYLVSDFVVDFAEKHQVLLVVAHGRTNTDFQYAGEVDVLRVKREMEAFYNIDQNRIYLLGVSMGGAGTWQIGVHYPHLFAGIAPINGQADWFRFWHDQFDYPPRDELPAHIEWIVALNNPMDLAANLSNLYSYSQHATNCFLGPDHTHDMVKQLKNIDAPHDTFEDPSSLGHYIYWRPDCWGRAFEHLVQQERVVHPKSIRYTTYSLRFHEAYWTTIQRFVRWGEPATVQASYEGDGKFVVQTENVARLDLKPPPQWRDETGQIKVQWNDQSLMTLKVDETGTAQLDAPGWSEDSDARHAKTRAVCGPAADVFNFPFIAVRGTSGGDAETERLERLARLFVDDWDQYGEGRVAMVRDDEVTEEMIKEKGLVLFGLPETNRIIGRLHEDLPFKLSEDTIELPDGKTYPTQGNGLILTYPNPLAPERYILIYNGLHWGEGRSASHRFDRLPDFIIFRKDPLPGIGSNKFLAAGLFDAYWRYDPALTDFEKN